MGRFSGETQVKNEAQEAVVKGERRGNIKLVCMGGGERRNQHHLSKQTNFQSRRNHMCLPAFRDPCIEDTQPPLSRL